MQICRDSKALKALVTHHPNEQLRQLIARRLQDLADYSDYELGELINVLVIEPSDTLTDVEVELGFLLRDRLVDVYEQHPQWIELTYIISDDGFGWVVYVPVGHPITQTLPPQN
jgi:hypothetical protein